MTEAKRDSGFSFLDERGLLFVNAQARGASECFGQSHD